MGDVGSAEGRSELAEARATIARLTEEIGRLRRRLADERLVDDLRDALTLVATAGTIATSVPHARLLEMIVETAADVIGARAGALFLVDEDGDELIFEVAIGPKAAEVKRFRVPIGHGIAGLVAVTGQPMAVANAREDARQAKDIAESVGYLPESILCVPLFYGDRTIGVLELLDKEGQPTFSATDLDTLALFADQAGVAVEQSRTHRDLAALLSELLGAADTADAALHARARGFVAAVEAEDVSFREALELATLVQEIAWSGERESNACRTMLRGFAEYLRLRPAAGGTGMA